MNKISSFFVFILTVTILVGCTQKTQEESTSVSETAPDAATVVVEEKVASPEPVKEQSQSMVQDTAVSSVVSQEGAAIASSEALEKPTDEQIQTALKNAGLYDGSIDGVMGKKTKKAIEDFQSQNNLVVDGKVGRQTWDKLKTYLSAPPANSISD